MVAATTTVTVRLAAGLWGARLDAFRESRCKDHDWGNLGGCLTRASSGFGEAVQGTSVVRASIPYVDSFYSHLTQRFACAVYRPSPIQY